jgi:leucine rich repeat (LRR) protein
VELDERLGLAYDPGTPATTLIELAGDASSQVRAAVAARPDAPAQALRPLARDFDRDVREAVARNPSTSQGNLLRLLADADRWVRWAVAGNPGCDEQVRRAMAKTADKELRGLLAEMPELEPDLAEALLDDRSPEVRERLATHTRDPAVITALLADRTVRVRKGLALNQRTTPEQRHALALDTAVDVRSALVRAVDLDEADLWLLVGDRSAEVRKALAGSARTPPHIREALEDDADESVAAEARRVRQAPAARPARRGPRRFITGPGRQA